MRFSDLPIEDIRKVFFGPGPGRDRGRLNAGTAAR